MTKQKHHSKVYIPIILIILILVYIASAYYTAIDYVKPSISLANSKLTITTPVSNLPWPSYGEAAVGLSNGQIIASHGTQKPEPTASVAKLFTALAVLSKYPLKLNQPGPMITITTADYQIYVSYIKGQGSVVPVYTGEQLSEHQMLEAMLVPSGDNIADSLAIWAYGSLKNYQNYANQQLIPSLGLKNSYVGTDASGYSPTTTTTAVDMIKLGGDVLNNPVLAQIVNMKSVNVPNVGVMTNYNQLLGINNIVGIKTGNSNQAGGVFLGAADATVNKQSIPVLTAIMQAPTLNIALQNSDSLITAMENNFQISTVFQAGEILGEYNLPWGGHVQISLRDNVNLKIIGGEQIQASLKLNKLSTSAQAGSQVGVLNIPANQLNPAVNIPIYTNQNATKPSLKWRLTHPQYFFNKSV